MSSTIAALRWRPAGPSGFPRPRAGPPQMAAGLLVRDRGAWARRAPPNFLRADRNAIILSERPMTMPSLSSPRVKRTATRGLVVSGLGLAVIAGYLLLPPRLAREAALVVAAPSAPASQPTDAPGDTAGSPPASGAPRAETPAPSQEPASSTVR